MPSTEVPQRGTPHTHLCHLFALFLLALFPFHSKLLPEHLLPTEIHLSWFPKLHQWPQISHKTEFGRRKYTFSQGHKSLYRIGPLFLHIPPEVFWELWSLTAKGKRWASLAFEMDAPIGNAATAWGLCRHSPALAWWGAQALGSKNSEALVRSLPPRPQLPPLVLIFLSSWTFCLTRRWVCVSLFVELLRGASPDYYMVYQGSDQGKVIITDASQRGDVPDPESFYQWCYWGGDGQSR